MDNLYNANTLLSINIPNRILIDQCDENIFSISVQLNNTTIYSTTMEAVDGIAYFYDLNVIVHEYMKEHLMAYARLTFNAYFDMGMHSVDTMVVYATMPFDMDDLDENLLKSSYLTTRTFYTIPRGYGRSVAFFNEADDQSPMGYMDLTVRYDDGSIHQVQLAHILYDFREARVYYFTLREDSINRSLREAFPSQPMTVLGGSVVHGDRHLQFYFVDEQPKLVFQFWNAFNIAEDMFIYGTQTVKLDVSAKEAVAGGRLYFYNRSSERKFQVETIPLEKEEALWFNQFLESPRVLYLINGDIDEDALISDVSSEVSDSAKEQTIIKFSYRLGCQHDWVHFPSVRQVFNYNYTQPFQ